MKPKRHVSTQKQDCQDGNDQRCKMTRLLGVLVRVYRVHPLQEVLVSALVPESSHSMPLMFVHALRGRWKVYGLLGWSQCVYLPIHVQGAHCAETSARVSISSYRLDSTLSLLLFQQANTDAGATICGSLTKHNKNTMVGSPCD